MAKKNPKLVKNLIEKDLHDLAVLTKEMARLAEIVDNLPEDFSWSVEELDILEGTRHEAFRLKESCTAALEAFTGGS